ncbi:Histone-lysine N-methyltransferase, H3 lysine-9 specific protein [Quillaja saponaria]|uniref:Histone-lysine N-methyltransferase, H3 lysine-9 specific protein n=1 Tax=Quillaja saponaria TaxID=32244 RepID=A0AAD7PEE2_QUISA|nr:Histone-lysine N-methyltransferase, H3 lysine-9 specific protein [Quillaja saponaria]
MPSRKVTSVNGTHSEGKSGKPHMANDGCPFYSGSPHCKPRKVSAIREFPAGCGRFAPRIDLTPNVGSGCLDSEEGSSCGDKSGDDLGADRIRSSKLEAKSETSEVLGSSVPDVLSGRTNNLKLNIEILAVSSAQVDGHPSIHLEDLNDAGSARCVEVAEQECSDMSKELHQVRISSSDTVLHNGPKFRSPPDVTLVGSCNGLEKALAERYPPRRRVSAIRDFPPLCGRNASPVSKDECLKVVSHLNGNSLTQQISAEVDNPSREVTEADAKQKEKYTEDGGACEGLLGGNVSKLTMVGETIRINSEGNATEELKKLDEFGPSSGMKVAQDGTREIYNNLPNEGSQCHSENMSIIVFERDLCDAVDLDKISRMESMVHLEEIRGRRKLSDVSSCQRCSQEDFGRLEFKSDRMVVLGLMAESGCPGRQGKASKELNMAGGTNQSKQKKAKCFAQLEKSKSAIKAKDMANHSRMKSVNQNELITGTTASQGTSQLVIWGKEDFRESDGKILDFYVAPRSSSFNVNLPPYGHGGVSGQGHDTDSNVTRNKVRETLRLFQVVCRKLLQEEEAKLKERGRRRIDLDAAKILRDKDKYINTGKHIIGSVPGVEVGDEFHYRVELNIIGLHRASQGGIDYMKHGGKILATSVVASGGYADDLDNSDALTYTGQGGNLFVSDKRPEDQKLVRGNLALKNSSEAKNLVRVIRGSESKDGKSKTYVYDGLYIVNNYWEELGPHGKMVFKFLLHRVPGQPELAWKEVKKSKKSKIREGLCVEDISNGKELFPICAVNTIDDEKPPSFNYITGMIYPDWCNPIPPRGCNCTDGCSDSEKCSCAVKNGGEIPFNHNGAIVEAKRLVYECGPCCKCPSTCHNRVSQQGIKFQLELFKTRTRGWGVRSLNSIPSGSFICEYMGELLEEREADERTRNDEYLFDIGNNYSDNTLWDGLSTLMPDVDSSSCEGLADGGFTIDAAQYGNVGRFINHSCSPNLYAQNVVYDHDDKRIPHIMLFAAENIPPLQELTYHYNYMIDQVYDSDGNIKKKSCYCGSLECTGRMY